MIVDMDHSKIFKSLRSLREFPSCLSLTCRVPRARALGHMRQICAQIDMRADRPRSRAPGVLEHSLSSKTIELKVYLLKCSDIWKTCFPINSCHDAQSPLFNFATIILDYSPKAEINVTSIRALHQLSSWAKAPGNSKYQNTMWCLCHTYRSLWSLAQ